MSNEQNPFETPQPSKTNPSSAAPPKFWLARNIAAVILGWFVGSVVNITIVNVGMAMAPLPGVTDSNDMEQLKAAMPNMEAKHAAGPFLAHALGTLVGAIVAVFVAATRKKAFAYTIGVLFLLGGIAMCIMVPAPSWFMALDLIGAYLPMAWLATLFVKPARTAGLPS